MNCHLQGKTNLSVWRNREHLLVRLWNRKATHNSEKFEGKRLVLGNLRRQTVAFFGEEKDVKKAALCNNSNSYVMLHEQEMQPDETELELHHWKKKLK
ncbi:hypothetical protein Nepgr_009901 [Nepenthes gracilis]|uniref:Uncharacterized protein n=1 Tax=Nepenthes gracilis TaxID=150966 RepID=A0AAD3SC72_NEPGR|nr:hypothetical protein Nepgr_009901 [Nepenthes gracilis]